MTDEGSILFPSVTICKDDLYDRSGGIITDFKSSPVEEAGALFRVRTFSRARLVKFLGTNTVAGVNNYPCNTVGGPRAGEACSFPVMYPDCGLERKSRLCEEQPGIAAREYNYCEAIDQLDKTDGLPWCYTRTYHNKSHITLQFGYCSTNCTKETAR